MNVDFYHPPPTSALSVGLVSSQQWGKGRRYRRVGWESCPSYFARALSASSRARQSHGTWWEQCPLEMYTVVALPWPVLNQTVKREVGHRPVLFLIVFLFQMVMVPLTPHPPSLLSKALCVWLTWAITMCGWPWFHALWAVILGMLLTSFCFMGSWVASTSLGFCEY